MSFVFLCQDMVLSFTDSGNTRYQLWHDDYQIQRLDLNRCWLNSYFLLTPERASSPLNRMYTLVVELTYSVTKGNEGVLCCEHGRKLYKYNQGKKKGLMGRCQYVLNCDGWLGLRRVEKEMRILHGKEHERNTSAVKMCAVLGQCWLSLAVGERGLGADTVRKSVKNRGKLSPVLNS